MTAAARRISLIVVIAATLAADRPARSLIGRTRNQLDR
jgi:hypothetical protein